MPGVWLPALPFPHGPQSQYTPDVHRRTAGSYCGTAGRETQERRRGRVTAYNNYPGISGEKIPGNYTNTRTVLLRWLLLHTIQPPTGATSRPALAIFEEETIINGDFRGEKSRIFPHFLFFGDLPAVVSYETQLRSYPPNGAKSTILCLEIQRSQ